MKDLRCYVSLHQYVEHHSPDGSGVYLECSRCGNVKDVPDGRAGLGFGG
ncbi:MAG TPA: hypothetical protein VES02_15815 [Dermatophilaceae bacterium]|nr:hypothetical protein [Dermatophilaceae bacterium]